MKFAFDTSVKLEDGILKTFLDETRSLTPYARGEALQKSDSLSEAHEEVAAEGQTTPSSRDDTLITHFVAYVHKNGHLYELDGRREFPINRGATTPENLLKVIFQANLFYCFVHVNIAVA